jgi:hypothetical protein
MCLSQRSDEHFRDRPASRGVDDESRYERSQIESAVEPVGEGSQVLACVLAVLQRMKSTGQGGLQVTEHCVDQLELRQIAGLESTDDQRPVGTFSVGHRREAAQPIANHQGTRPQTGFGPIATGRRGEATDQVELDVHRMSCLVERDCRHERHLVLGATSWFAAAEVGVVQLDRAVQAMSAVLPGHGAVVFLVQQLRRGITDTQVALERQRRKAGFGLADQADGEEPCRQRQLGVLHQTKVPRSNWRGEQLFVLCQALVIHDEIGRQLNECDAKLQILQTDLGPSVVDEGKALRRQQGAQRFCRTRPGQRSGCVPIAFQRSRRRDKDPCEDRSRPLPRRNRQTLLLVPRRCPGHQDQRRQDCVD